MFMFLTIGIVFLTLFANAMMQFYFKPGGVPYKLFFPAVFGFFPIGLFSLLVWFEGGIPQALAVMGF